MGIVQALTRNSGSSEMRIDGGDCDWIQSGMERGGWLVDIGTSQPNMVEYPKRNTTGVSPQLHIKFIYYVTYILEYFYHAYGDMCIQGVYTKYYN